MDIRVSWSSLLQITELDFTPEAPKVLKMDDKLLQAISWLTACNRHERKLLRCDENGALLFTDAWNGFNSVEVAEKEPETSAPKTYTPTVEHKGILISTAAYLIKLSFKRTGTTVYEHTFVPAASFYWYPHSCVDVVISLVPLDADNSCIVGVTAYN